VRNFIRKIENFTCEHCGELVVGDGYTDHCPKCLWAKHMDQLIPGDRESDCKGMMEPIKTLYEKGIFKVFYRCMECGHEFGVREGKDDDRNKLIDLLENSVKI
jgi:rubrerythrin